MNYKYYRIKVERDSDPQNPRNDDTGYSMFVCKHGRYLLGDDEWNKKFTRGTGIESVKAAMLSHFVGDTYLDTLPEGADEDGEATTAFTDEQFDKHFVWQYLYLYDHSGITMACGHRNPFQCSFDSGVVGIAAVYKPAIILDFKLDAADDNAVCRKGNAIIDSDCETYTAYLEGDVWGYTVEELVEKTPTYKHEWEKPLYELPGGNEGFSGELFDDCEGTEVPEELATVAEWQEVDGCWGFYGDVKRSGIVEEIAGVIGDSAAEVRSTVREAKDSSGEWVLYMKPVSILV